MRVARVPTVLAAVAVALAAGCGGDGGDGDENGTTTVAVGKATVLAATLTASAERPKGPKGASGTASITLDPGKSQACWRLTVNGTDKPISAHVHVGAAGENGDVVIPLGDTFVRRGCVLTGQRVLREVAASPGDYYVNVHTQKHLQGAVRGPLRPASS
jgi:hypothetical protein